MLLMHWFESDLFIIAPMNSFMRCVILSSICHRHAVSSWLPDPVLSFRSSSLSLIAVLSQLTGYRCARSFKAVHMLSMAIVEPSGLFGGGGGQLVGGPLYRVPPCLDSIIPFTAFVVVSFV